MSLFSSEQVLNNINILLTLIYGNDVKYFKEKLLKLVIGDAALYWLKDKARKNTRSFCLYICLLNTQNAVRFLGILLAEKYF